jgi:hypothetical protein
MTLENFLIQNGVNPKSMVLLGSGENGTAWKCGDLVIKQTRSVWEWDFAIKQLKGLWPNFATMYACLKNDEYYFYIAEYLEKGSEDDGTADDIYVYYSMVESALSTQDLDPLDADLFNLEEFTTKYKKGLSSGALTFFEDLALIATDMKKIGGTDLHAGNLGYNSDKRLKAYDIDINTEDKDTITGYNPYTSNLTRFEASRKYFRKTA